MAANQFNEADFALFDIPTLAEQMPLVRRQIQPVFRNYGRQLQRHIQERTGKELPLYVAKHIQRRVNPLRHTWVALGGDNRGYKKYPHWEIGINRYFVYIMLCYQKNMLEKEQMADYLLAQDWTAYPDDFDYMTAHFGPEYYSIHDGYLDQALKRYRQIKLADFQIGRALDARDACLTDPDQLLDWLIRTVDELLPLYVDSMQTFNQLCRARG